MRKYIFSFIVLLFVCDLTHAQVIPKVDERVELTSIVFFLAGAPEYSTNMISSYRQDINEYFEKYKNHPIVQYAIELRNKQGIAYTAIASAAICLKIIDNRVKSSIDSESITIYDHRWTDKSFNHFLKLLDDFYQKTDFRIFYNDHKDFYALVEQNIVQLFDEKIRPEWFESFYGESLGKPNVYIGICNGPHNYAIGDPLSPDNAGIVIGVSTEDDNGIPIFRNNDLFVIMHELNHRFSNPLINKYWNEIEPSANIIYPYVKEIMLQHAYGDAKTTFIEWLTNLCTIMYFKDNGLSVRYLISAYQDNGFIWLERSIDFMKNFYNNRELYPNMEEFIPQIIGFLNFTAGDFTHVKLEFNNRYPYVVSVYPSVNSNIYQHDEILIEFSEPMSTFAHGLKYVEGVDILPFVGEAKWINDYTVSFKINSNGLKKDKQYGFSLPSMFFLSQRNYCLIEDFTITYNTYEK